MRPLLLFYLLVIYVLLQFSWWTYLLVELNKEVYKHKIELAASRQPSDAVVQEAELKEELRERWVMIAGEGVVFITLLIAGIFMTRNAFRKEVVLARQQKNFLLSITHEFKSPLAAIKLSLQTLQKRILARDQQESILSKALNETDRVHYLIENALLAARIESHSFKLQKEEFNLSECIRSLVHNRHIPGVTSREINLELTPDVYIKGDPQAISSLMLNLIENAEKYSPENKSVHVELQHDRKNAFITISDLGMGIPDAEKPRIFDKFYRIGNEDTRNTKGTGLGLYIVRHITNLHHGEIRVSDNVPNGTVFKVTLPVE